MKRTTTIALALFVFVGLLATPPGGVADEGMFPFDNLPKKLLAERYGFELTDDWARHVRLSSVRFPGGSGSIVSPRGLVMTNHHVGQSAVHALSTAEHDYVEDGFLALRPEDELRCEGLSLDQLVAITDVTDRIREAVGQKTGKDAAVARRKVTADIVAKESEASGHKAEVKSFYGGDQYCVYRYKVFDDVRLVFSPEKSIAAFGGDRDNFCYPRWCLDVAYFRVYENDEPAKTEHYFRWRQERRRGWRTRLRLRQPRQHRTTRAGGDVRIQPRFLVPARSSSRARALRRASRLLVARSRSKASCR